MSDNETKDKGNAKKKIDYMHPQGSPSRPPRNEEERKNEREANESSKLVKELQSEDDNSSN
jgi:hypothetical protein